ncbi:MAG: hypothetical protein EB107_11605, partial [Proteobacteria bacterium]|nr:hypothetical protein [Pseudomonadota bacterium]
SGWSRRCVTMPTTTAPAVTVRRLSSAKLSCKGNVIERPYRAAVVCREMSTAANTARSGPACVDPSSRSPAASSARPAPQLARRPSRRSTTIVGAPSFTLTIAAFDNPRTLSVTTYAHRLGSKRLHSPVNVFSVGPVR